MRDAGLVYRCLGCEEQTGLEDEASVGICRHVTNDALHGRRRKTACVTAGNAAAVRSRLPPAKAEAMPQPRCQTRTTHLTTGAEVHRVRRLACGDVFSGFRQTERPAVLRNKFDCAGTLYYDLEKATRSARTNRRRRTGTYG